MKADVRESAQAIASGRRWPVKLDLAIVIVFTLLATLPFINKPFHMDDAAFLELAKIRIEEPFEVTIEDYVFFGEENERFIDTHPPLISSYLALLLKMAGTDSEAFLHGGFLIFPLIAAVSMYFLARRYTRYALLAALLLMATPGAMVMSHGLMSDIPGLSMWLASITLYAYALDQRNAYLFALSGLAISIGILISYQALSVIPLLFVYALWKKQLSLMSVAPFLLSLAVFFGFMGWHYSAAGSFPRFSYGVGEPLAWHSLIQKGASALLIIGGATIFFGVLMRVLLARREDAVFFVVFLVPFWILYAALYLAGKVGLMGALLSMALMPLGLLFLYRIFVDGWARLKASSIDRGENLLLMLWLAGVLVYVVILAPYTSVRYLLPMYPALVLLFVRLAEDRLGIDTVVTRRVLAVGVVTTLLFGLLVSAADYQHASANRAFAETEGAAYAERLRQTGAKGWTIGEFGFRYYMKKQGYAPLPGDRTVDPYDIIVQAPLADPRIFSEELSDQVELLEKVEHRWVVPLRTTSFRSNAGFYGHFWGLLPFSIDSGPVEEFDIYEAKN